MCKSVDTDYGVQVLIAVKRLNLKSPSVYICSEYFQHKSLQKQFSKCQVLNIFFVGQSCVNYEMPKSQGGLYFVTSSCRPAQRCISLLAKSLIPLH